MIRKYLIGICILAISALPALSQPLNPINYPWRGADAIVKAGENFTIRYHAKAGETAKSVKLTGPYQEVALTIENQIPGAFEIDEIAGASVSLRIVVKVPSDAPDDLYDLVVTTNQREAASLRSVKTYKQAKDTYYFIHWTDDHYMRDEHAIQPVVTLVNTLRPEFVVNTGDFGENDLESDYDFNRYFDGGKDLVSKRYLPGIDEVLEVPMVIAPGNHDTDGQKSIPVRSLDYVNWAGSRRSGTKYGDTRILALDDFVGGGGMKPEDNAYLDNWLQNEGSGGKFFVAGHHHPGRVGSSWLSSRDIDVLLNGHRHSNRTTTSGGATVFRGGYLSASVRLIEVKNNRMENNWILETNRRVRLRLTYKNENDGSHASNEAVLNNKYPVAIPSAFVRFVMPRGTYQVTGGTLVQQFEGTDFSIYDVRTPVPASTSMTISIDETADPTAR